MTARENLKSVPRSIYAYRPVHASAHEGATQKEGLRYEENCERLLPSALIEG